jgi:hypothetical protein
MAAPIERRAATCVLIRLTQRQYLTNKMKIHSQSCEYYGFYDVIVDDKRGAL